MSKLFKIFSSLAVFICVFTLIGLNASKAIAYDNSTFSGPWIGCDINDSEPGILLPCIYMLPDGRGTITDMGVFYPPDVMTYNVSGSGMLTMFVQGEGAGSGQLTSNTLGYINFVFDDSGRTLRFDIFKVRDAGAMQGAWSGRLGSYDISFNVDRYGEVQNFSGIQGPVTGRLFKEGSTVAGFLRTGLPDKYEDDSRDYIYNQIGINGQLSGNVLSGRYETDSNYPLETFTLTRHGGPGPSPELTDREKADIIFNWLEALVPEILKPSPQRTQELLGIIFRYYPATDVYIATYQNHLFYIDHLGNVHDLGEVDLWLPIAQGG